ncbi:MAG: hypothetical protein NBV67_05780 [Tagaea sp.]|nr:hypothetical protein [Tagaea sp.]
MRTLAFIVLIAGAPAGAQDFVQRDPSGRRVATFESDQRGGYVQRDPSGRRIATYESDGRGGYVIRDPSGRRIGTLERR